MTHLRSHHRVLSQRFPKSEVFGLVSQMRRTAVSVPSNIAEGAARNSTEEFLRFLNVSGGSLSELDTQVEIAMRLGCISSKQKEELDGTTDSMAGKLPTSSGNRRKGCDDG
ncbi:MAG: four helix bundle protein [Gammaproteobacteria bacterium]